MRPSDGLIERKAPQAAPSFQVIGINTWKIRSAAAESLGFAVSAEVVSAFINQYISR